MGWGEASVKKHEWLYSELRVPLGAGASEPEKRARHWFLEQHVRERPSVQLVTFFHLEPQLPRFFQALRGRCSQHHGRTRQATVTCHPHSITPPIPVQEADGLS